MFDTQPLPMSRTNLLSIVLAISAALTLPVFAVTTDPAGFITLTVEGHDGAAASKLSYIGLSMTQIPAHQGTFESAAGAVVTDNEGPWTDNQYNGAGNAHYVELITGTGAGIMTQITGTNNAGNSLTLAEDLSGFITGQTPVSYRIRKNWTIGSLFGATNSAGLGGGTSTTADEVLVYNPLAMPAGYTTYYYKTSGVGGIGWRSTNSTSVDESGAPLAPTTGIIVRRKQAADVSFPLTGAVKLGQTAIPIETGLNFVSNVFPSGNMTLGNCNLVTSGFFGGTSTSADHLLLYNHATGAYKTYYFKTSGVGGTGWRSTDSTTIDETNTPLPFGQSFIVKRNGGRAPFDWTAPQPFVVN